MAHVAARLIWSWHNSLRKDCLKGHFLLRINFFALFIVICSLSKFQDKGKTPASIHSASVKYSNDDSFEFQQC